MIVQVQDIIKQAFGVIGEIEIDETPTSSDMNMCLQVLNIMMDKLSANRLTLRTTSADSLPLIPGKYLYTIGAAGADITSAKPISITDAFIRDLYGIDTPVNIISRDEYDAYIDKSFSQARPYSLFYDPGQTQQVQNKGNISLYPIPDATMPYTLFFNSDKYLTEFGSIFDTVTFEPAYYEFFVYNLAVRIFRRYNDSKVPIPVDVIGIANEATRTIETMNAVQVTASMDIPGSPVTYNIFNDTFR